MADTTEQTVETSQNGLMDFNWDEGSSDSFFGLNEFGDENKTPAQQATPAQADELEETEDTDKPESTAGLAPELNNSVCKNNCPSVIEITLVGI